MANSFRVRIDLQKIQENLTAAGDPLSQAEVLTWLVEEGFLDQGNGWWVCEEVTLDVLDPSEILETRRIC